MAFDVNPALVLNLKSIENWRGLIRHRLRNQINSVRSWTKSLETRGMRRQLTNSDVYDLTDSISEEFEAQAVHFRNHGWAYVPKFFSQDVHQGILESWPSLSHFSVGSDPTKSYDKGPRWPGGAVGEISSGIPSDFYLGFRALISEEFQNRVSSFCNDGTRRINTSLATAWARVGSLLLPHIDDVWQFGRGAVINFVIFIDGTEPVSESGATAIYATNDYGQPIFIPTELRNTALVYETGRLIYHGFPRVGRGKFSKRLIAQYSPENQPKLSDFTKSASKHIVGPGSKSLIV